MRNISKDLLCIFLVLFAGASLAQTKLRAWNIHPEGYPVTEAVKSFAEEVGKVTKGMDIVEKIKAVPTATTGGHQNVPATPVMIESIRLVDAPTGK